MTGHQLRPDREVIVDRWGFPTLDAATTWLQLAATLPLDDLIVVGDHLAHQPVFGDRLDPRPYCSLEDLAAQVSEYSGRGAKAATEAAKWIRTGSESPREILLRLLLVRAGLPEPQLNVEIRDRNGRFLGRADQAFPDFMTIAEYDGDHHRTDSRQYEHDVSRIDSFIDEEWRVVRVRARGITVARQETVERVKRALRAGGWRG